jgi:hypothetical protein
MIGRGPLVYALAVAGGFFVGSLLTVLLAVLLVRTVTRQRLPRAVLAGLGLLGGVTAAWLVWWLVGDWYGPGRGPGPGGGTGGNGVAVQNEKGQPAKGDEARAVSPSESVRVEVLGDPALQRIAGGSRFDPERSYRVETGDGSRLMTLAEVKDFILRRTKQEPPLRQVTLVFYDDSPAQGLPRVDRLKDWAEGLTTGDKGERMRVDSYYPGGNAPAR